MDHLDTCHIGDTIRIRRPPKVFTNELGQNIWMSGVDPVDAELEIESDVSTNPYDRNDHSYLPSCDY